MYRHWQKTETDWVFKKKTASSDPVKTLNQLPEFLLKMYCCTTAQCGQPVIYSGTSEN